MTPDDHTMPAAEEDLHALLARLAESAPEALGEVLEDLFAGLGRIRFADLAIMADVTLWAASQEDSFGREVARGFTRLLLDGIPSEGILAYGRAVREAGSRGPETGRILARHLVPVVQNGTDRFLRHFLTTVDVLMRKGAYALYSPLEVLSGMFLQGADESAEAFMDLIHTVFNRDISYNRSRHLCHVLSVSAGSMCPEKQSGQLRALRHVAAADLRLIDPFLEGLEKGLYRMGHPALEQFVSIGLARFRRSRISGERFLSLESRESRKEWDRLETGVTLPQIGAQLARYLRARIGFPVVLRPLTDFPAAGSEPLPEVCTDGSTLYLPGDISRFPGSDANRKQYWLLARLEAGVLEFGSYGFDLEKVRDRLAGRLDPVDVALDASFSDLNRFFAGFPDPTLASELFTLLDGGRIRILCETRYPGLLRKLIPRMEEELDRTVTGRDGAAVLRREMVRRILLGLPTRPELPAEKAKRVEEVASALADAIQADSSVESVGVVVFEQVPVIQKWFDAGKTGRFPFPWGRRLFPGPAHAAFRKSFQTAEKIRSVLARKGIRLYRSEILSRIMRAGKRDPEAVRNLIRTAGIGAGSEREKAEAGTAPAPEEEKITWYPEWDESLTDYVFDHVRVVDRKVPEGEEDFYRHTLTRHAGRIAGIRRAFEMLQPQGIARLRPWAEGDEFDYPAMMDFAADRRQGRMPSDRLYIKRMKQERSVSVLLLVDLSRSTSHPAAGKTGLRKSESVLDVEKEAIVLFAEALESIGDDFAVAGFSGSGRLSVEYFRIKDFQDPPDSLVRRRIGALSPQRNTRMGAAIRHGARELGGTRSAVKLMIVLGDGFPNDTGYKQEYAIADTHQAILEAFSRHIHVRAITVNMAGDPRLDELYGARHHHVISDVTELPERLVSIYRTLTRM